MSKTNRSGLPPMQEQAQKPAGWEGFEGYEPTEEELNQVRQENNGRFLTAYNAETQDEIETQMTRSAASKDPPAYSILSLPIPWYRGGGHGAFLVNHGKGNKRTMIGKFKDPLHARIFAFSIAQAFVQIGPEVVLGIE